MSFPDRRLVIDQGQSVRVVPKEGTEHLYDGERYLYYNALVSTKSHVIAGNGTHVDFIEEAVEGGIPILKAIESVLATLGPEKNKEATPRIVAAIPPEEAVGWLGIVRRDALIVRELTLRAGDVSYLAVKGFLEQRIDHCRFDSLSVEDLAKEAFEGPGLGRFSFPLAAAVAFCGPSGNELSVYQTDQ
jgi:IMP cyclohydrolase